jgi:curved DNA-binding protein CbpA
MVFTNYYKTLEVAVDASAADIKSAYRSLSKRYHPDVNDDNARLEDRFKDVQEAYGVLSDPATRRLYDKVFKRYSTAGFPSGNTILIPEDAAGKPAYSWHPDYRSKKAPSPLTRQGGIIIGIVVIIVVSVCTWAIQHGESEKPTAVGDADRYVTTSQLQPAPATAKPRQEAISGSRSNSAKETASIQLSSISAPGAIDVPAAPTPARAALRSLPPAAPSALAIPASTTVTAQPVRLPTAPPEALTASIGKVLPAPVGGILSPVPFLPERSALPTSVSSRRDTDVTDLMVRRVRDVRFGYTVVVLKRTYHFKDKRPSQSKTIRYVSSVLLYKLSDLADKDAIVKKMLASTTRMESSLTFTETFTATFEIVDQALKTFDTQTEALASAKAEGTATQIRM